MVAVLLLIAALAGGGTFAFLQTQSEEDTVVAPAITTTTTSQATTTTEPPATTTKPPATTTSPRVTTTTKPAVVTTTLLEGGERWRIALEERTVLTATYVWGPIDQTLILQKLLGVVAYGYGYGTRNAHLAELKARGLPTGGVPSPPTTTTIGPSAAEVAEQSVLTVTYQWGYTQRRLMSGRRSMRRVRGSSSGSAVTITSIPSAS